MKKLVWICLLLAFLLSGCSTAPEDPAELTGQSTQANTPAPTVESTPEPTPDPTPEPEPETVPGVVVGTRLGAVYRTLDRGETLPIIEEEEGYFLVDLDGTSCFIQKCFLRPEEESAPEPRYAYARGATGLFPTVYREGESLARVGFNDPLYVIDEFGAFLLVEKDGVQGYVLESETIGYPLQPYSGGNGSGGQDGGDIHLAYRVKRSGGYRSLSTARTGTVLADGTEAYLALLEHGNPVKVLSFDEERCELYLNGQVGTVPRWAVCLREDTPYEEWEGFAAANAGLYRDYRMLELEEELTINTPVYVLADLGDRLLVTLDVKMFYMSPDSVKDAPVVYSAPSGDSGGEWTEPVL